MPIGSKIVAVDLPTGDTKDSLVACVDELRGMGYNATLVFGDSTKEDVISTVRQLAPFDACLIDANHTLPYVELDYLHYGPLAKVIAFHDINHTRKVTPGRMPIEIAPFWKKVKDTYRHDEIKHDPDTNGFGILYRNEPVS